MKYKHTQMDKIYLMCGSRIPLKTSDQPYLQLEMHKYIICVK